MGSPLAIALAYRGVARYWLGRPGWRDDLRDAVAMARSSDPVTHAVGRRLDIRYRDPGRCAAGRRSACARDRGCAAGRRTISSGDTALGSRPVRRWVWLLTYRHATADHHAGWSCWTQVRDMWLRERTRLYLVTVRPTHTLRVRGLGAVTAMGPSRRCAKPSTICSRRAAAAWGIGPGCSGGDAAGPWRRG